jgi:FecR protein
MGKKINITELIAAYLDDTLSAEEAKLLVELLATDKEAVATFTRLARTEAQLQLVLNDRREERSAVRLRDRMDSRYIIAQQLLPEPMNEQQQPVAPAAPRIVRDRRLPVIVGLAASLLITTAALRFYSSWQEPLQFGGPKTIAKIEPSSPPVATLRRTKRMKWGDDEAIPSGTRLAAGKSIRFYSGLVEIAYDSGTVAVLKGPAEAVIRSNRLLELRRGAITTVVAEGDEGFRVETRSATVVDLSTAFGVSVSDREETNVVVFDGKIDLHLDAEDGVRDLASHGDLPSHAEAPVELKETSATFRHMTAGDGVLIDPQGRVSRLVAINSSAFPTSSTFDVALSRQKPLIASVRDTFGEGETTKCYQIVSAGLTEDAAAYVDRVYQWNGITEAGMPAFLHNADYVMTFNDDKYVHRMEMDVTLSAPAMLYVFIDDRVPLPEWLTADFEDTGEDIGLDEVRYPRRGKEIPPLGAGNSINSIFSIWKREIPHATTVRLGSLEIRQAIDAADMAMYGVAAVPLSADRPAQ